VLTSSFPPCGGLVELESADLAYLDGSMISHADGIHLLLFFPCAATLWVKLSVSSDKSVEKRPLTSAAFKN
jgi:hypothetical protein